MYGRKVKLRFFFVILILFTLILSVFLIVVSNLSFAHTEAFTCCGIVFTYSLNLLVNDFDIPISIQEEIDFTRRPETLSIEEFAKLLH